MIILSAVVIVVGAVFFGISAASNEMIEFVDYTFESPRLPAAFDGYRIVQLTDMHNHDPNYDNGYILDLVKEKDPDLIVLTGDFIDSHTTEKNIADYRVLFSRMNAYRPVIFVTGNHEYYAAHQSDFLDLMYGLSNFSVLYDTYKIIEKGGASIPILGLHDPIFDTHVDFGQPDNDNVMRGPLKSLVDRVPGEGFRLLLSHRPDMGRLYAECGIDLTLSGHTHGGQMNFAPLKKHHSADDHTFKSGYYELGAGRAMIVSSGIGDSYYLPIRLNTPFQLVTVTLKRAQALS